MGISRVCFHHGQQGGRGQLDLSDLPGTKMAPALLLLLAVRCPLLSADGVGERLRGDRHADAAGGGRAEAVLPLLARRGLQPVPHLRGDAPQPPTAPPALPRWRRSPLCPCR